MYTVETGEDVMELVHTYKYEPDEMIEEIRNRYPKNPIIIWPDPSSVARKTKSKIYLRYFRKTIF